MVRSRGLEPPRVAPLAPQASASTNSATTADGRARADRPRIEATALDVTNRPQRNKGGGSPSARIRLSWRTGAGFAAAQDLTPLRRGMLLAPSARSKSRDGHCAQLCD